MAATRARLLKWTALHWRARRDAHAGWAAGEAKLLDDRARGRSLLASTVTVVTMALVVLGLGALVIAEYALLWHLLVVPWLDTIPPSVR